jgi:hypothetical protein
VAHRIDPQRRRSGDLPIVAVLPRGAHTVRAVSTAVGPPSVVSVHRRHYDELLVKTNVDGRARTKIICGHGPRGLTAGSSRCLDRESKRSSAAKDRPRSERSLRKTGSVAPPLRRRLQFAHQHSRHQVGIDRRPADVAVEAFVAVFVCSATSTGGLSAGHADASGTGGIDDHGHPRDYPSLMDRRTCSTGQSSLASITRTREPSA